MFYVIIDNIVMGVSGAFSNERLFKQAAQIVMKYTITHIWESFVISNVLRIRCLNIRNRRARNKNHYLN